MFIADFHIHSKYSRATSKDCEPEALDYWARRKGIGVVGTGDFTHRGWRGELREKLVQREDGLYTLKEEFLKVNETAGADMTPRFIVSGEISSIYKKNGKVRKVHNLILLPGLEEAGAIATRLEAVGNLHSDGRPILGLDSRDLLEIVLETCPEAIFIPAHIWTPHFSLFGAYSGFDCIEECFGDLTKYIYALETGLSSDPPMNWRLSALDGFKLVSNSDAHSPGKLAREANIFRTDLSYKGIYNALKDKKGEGFLGTIEFFPEEGKYHYDGHRACKVCWNPAETIAAGGVCPVCGGMITVGVLHRVEELADREEGAVSPAARHYESILPLAEVVAASLGYASVNSQKVKGKYEDLLQSLGPELFILREAELNDIELAAGPHIAEGIRRLREGRVEIRPGFDGEYGKIKIMERDEIEKLSGQLSLVNAAAEKVRGKKERQKSKKPVGARGRESSDSPAIIDEKATKSSPAAGGTINALSGLNEEQREAVCSSDAAIAVVAGPGTGKTKTLVSRIVYLIEERDISPEQITAVTFTNKAAREMRLRLEEFFGGKGQVKGITIGTFHSICLKYLSEERGGDKVVIIDGYEALAIMDELLSESGDKISPRRALRGISLLKNGISPGKGEKETVSPRLLEPYNSRLREYGVLDFDDIILEALDIFEREPTISEGSANVRRVNPFTHLLVDEFQDVNQAQYRLLMAWRRKSESIFIIGDPHQAIYGFRGSDSRYFSLFQENLSMKDPISLKSNYRSTPQIISAAASVISAAPGLTAGGVAVPALQAVNSSGLKVRLVETGGEYPEAIYVAKEIGRLVGGIDMLDASPSSKARGKKQTPRQARGFAEIAVLYRNNRQSELLEQCFKQEGIPYQVSGREEFLAEKPVREALTFFRCLLNPEDHFSLKRFVQSYSNREGENTGVLQEMLKKYELLIRSENPATVIEHWTKDNNLGGLKSMERLINMAVMYQDFPSLLQNILLGRESDLFRSGSRDYVSDAVRLMTIHAAKGLEFPLVFLCGLNDGILPLKRKDAAIDPEEERRLLYVGMTRAQDELILLTSATPSPFLAALPPGEISREKLTHRRKNDTGSKQISLFD